MERQVLCSKVHLCLCHDDRQQADQQPEQGGTNNGRQEQSDRHDRPEALLGQANPFFLPIIIAHLGALVVCIKACQVTLYAQSQSDPTK